jgi:CheY-like chemotaxis protein
MPPPTILVVDGCRWVAGALDSLLLPTLGCRVVYARNPRAALTVARTVQPNLVIAEVKRRVFKGIEFILEMRRDPDLGRIPAILWSDVYQPRDIEVLAEGCQPFTAWKKFDNPDGLVSLVENLVR